MKKFNLLIPKLYVIPIADAGGGYSLGENGKIQTPYTWINTADKITSSEYCRNAILLTNNFSDEERRKRLAAYLVIDDNTLKYNCFHKYIIAKKDCEFNPDDFISSGINPQTLLEIVQELIHAQKDRSLIFQYQSEIERILSLLPDKIKFELPKKFSDMGSYKINECWKEYITNFKESEFEFAANQFINDNFGSYEEANNFMNNKIQLGIKER